MLVDFLFYARLIAISLVSYFLSPTTQPFAVVFMGMVPVVSIILDLSTKGREGRFAFTVAHFGLCLFAFVCSFSVVQPIDLEKTAKTRLPSFIRSSHFDSTLLSEEELKSGWGSLKKDRRFEPTSENKEIKEYLLSNPEFCILGVSGETAPGLVRDANDLLWSVPQAWYHFRKDSCKIGIINGHGTADKIDTYLSEDLFAGLIQLKTLKDEEVINTYPNLKILFFKCRGYVSLETYDEFEARGKIYKEDGHYYTSRKGVVTVGHWLLYAFLRGDLQQLMSEIKSH